MSELKVVIHHSSAEVIEAVAERALRVLEDLTATKAGKPIHISLTGGSAGSRVLAQMVVLASEKEIDWQCTHWWWSDERFVHKLSADRNDLQFDASGLSKFPIPPGNVHRFGDPASTTLEQAVDLYTSELRNHAEFPNAVPRFNLTFLGVGADGHIASLFPHHFTLRSKQICVATEASPKPPLRRISFSVPTINTSERLWLLAVGRDKAEIAKRISAKIGSTERLPATLVRGSDETLLFTDQLLQ